MLISPAKRPEWKGLLSGIRKCGFNVLRTENANGAFDILRNERVKVIIAEYELPDTGGLEFLAMARSISPGVEVIFLSEKASLSVAIEAMKAGAYDFYEIPVNSNLLIAVLEKAEEKH